MGGGGGYVCVGGWVWVGWWVDMGMGMGMGMGMRMHVGVNVGVGVCDKKTLARIMSVQASSRGASSLTKIPLRSHAVQFTL